MLTSHYKCVMIDAMMVLALRAYLRACDMVPDPAAYVVQGCFHFREVTLNGDMLTFSFRQFKHIGRQGPKHIGRQGPKYLQVNGQRIPGTSIYPATRLRHFLQAMSSMQEHVHAYTDGTPVLRREFDITASAGIQWVEY